MITEYKAQYVVEEIDGRWWVVFRFSDGRFDKVTSFKYCGDAMRAATRMNRGMAVD